MTGEACLPAIGLFQGGCWPNTRQLSNQERALASLDKIHRKERHNPGMRYDILIS